MRTVRVRVEGRVQGVGYRAFVERNALALGLDGWVRNRRDGTVEAMFQGPDETIDEMLVLCRRGPSASAVTSLETIGEGAGALTGFDVRPTA
jgi:acylphosphatase